MSALIPVRAHAFSNPVVERQAPYPAVLNAILSERGLANARCEITAWPGYAPTPLHRLDGLARTAGLAALWYKDEGSRFGLGSFKALGGAYAVEQLLIAEIARRSGETAHVTDLLTGRYRDITDAITVTCATDGNHGRSVAWGAQTFGCRCVIYIHATVSPGRANAIARYGAEVVRTTGNYDESVRQAAWDAATHGWFVVSDTSYPGYLDVPKDVMQGYTLMADEVAQQLTDEMMPTHIFIQGGVGGMAAAVCARFWQLHGAARPKMVVVEPDRAACLYESARAGQPIVIHGDLDTVMAGLACGEVSLLAWDILQPGVDAFMTVDDEAALACMRLLAEGVGGDGPIVAGESAVAGLAGCLGVLADPESMAQLDLGLDSRVLLFGSEGDTDPELYRQIIGRDAQAVRATT
ncbi:MAG: diaminopropionate ammonia-lyase [Gammaproteobacteria bacterium]|nr:diaminopropionate ammonia-lyase [Gammaproteobacteria bacterium]